MPTAPKPARSPRGLEIGSPALRYAIGALLLAVPGLLAGCVPGEAGDDSDGGPAAPDGSPPAPGVIDRDAYFAARAALTCDLLRSCDLRPGGNEAAFAYGLRAAPETCPAYFEAVYRRALADDALPLADWDPAAWDRCRAGALTSCQQPEAIPACGAVFTGDLAVGESCQASPLSCAVEGYCDVPIGGRVCEAICIGRRPAGEPCGFDDECLLGPNLDGHCARGPDDERGICAPLALEGGAAVGEACGHLADPDSYRLVGCALGGWCDAPYLSPGTCQRALQPGAACEPGGAPCQVGRCEGGACLTAELTGELGAQCGDRDLPVCNPFAGLGCDFGSERCVRSDGGLDSPCGFAGGLPCQPGLYCRGAVCRPQVEPGDPCDVDDEYDPCRRGWCEDGDNGEGRCVTDASGDPCAEAVVP